MDNLKTVSIATKFSSQLNSDSISSQLKIVAELIKARDLRGNGLNRDVFYVHMGGFDGHYDLANILETRLPSLNSAVKNFW